jgi:prepilin peptidase CpaA
VIHSVVILLWLGLCAVQDMGQRQIANRLTLGAVLLALIYLLWTGSTWLGAPANEGGWAFALALASTLEHLLWSLIGAAVVQAGWLLTRQWLSGRGDAVAKTASIKQPFAPFLFTGFALYWFVLR